MTTQSEAERLADALESTRSPHLYVNQSADELRRLQAENERLTASLEKANSQAEDFERRWYLRGDELEALRLDAERYRWLRKTGSRKGCLEWGELGGVYQGLEEMDAFIDAAIAQAVQS